MFFQDGIDVEEWERSEAFYDDVTKQDRIKERLYEEEIEVRFIYYYSLGFKVLIIRADYILK